MAISEVEMRVRKGMCSMVLCGLISNPNIIRDGVTRMGIEHPSRMEKEDYFCNEAVRLTNKLVACIEENLEVEVL